VSTLGVEFLDVSRLCPNKGAKYRTLGSLKYIVFHRIGGADVGLAAARRFQVSRIWGQGVGMKNPYHYYIDREGVIEIAAPMHEVTPHAWKKNRQSIGVGVLGDFRSEAPTAAQWQAALALCLLLPPSLEICAHDELPLATSDPNKECPGRYFKVADLSQEVAEIRCQR